MLISGGDLGYIFWDRPISLGILVLTLVLAIYFSRRKQAISEQISTV